MGKKERIAILIVMYNDSDLLQGLIKSIQEQSSTDYIVYAIDNHEKQISASVLREMDPEAVIFPYQSNLGYAKANNYLAQKAIEAGFDYIFIVNPDVVLAKDCVEYLLKEIKSEPKFAAAGPLVMKGSPLEREEIQFYELSADLRRGYTRAITTNSFNILDLPESVEVNMVSGCAFMIRTDFIIKYGLFNEENFMYGDEIDLAYRIHLCGYKCIVTRNAKVWHDHRERTIDRYSLYFEYFYKTRNRILFIKRYYHFFRLFSDIIHEIFILPARIRWLYKLAGLQMIKYYYQGYLWGILGIKGEVNIFR